MKVSIVIPSYNSFPTISYTFRGLRAQTCAQSILEVIVVDSSDDGKTALFLRCAALNNIKIIHPGVHVMPATSRNIGARMAQGDVVAFLDADTCPEPDWLEQIIKAYKEGCWLGGGAVALPEFQSKKMIAAAQLFLEFNEFIGAQGENKIRREKKFVPSCNLFCDRKLFHEIGGFPQIRACEDVMFGMEAGKKTTVWFVPEVRVMHIFREAPVHFLANQMLLGRYALLHRQNMEYSKFYCRGLWPLVFLPGFMGIKFLRIAARMFREHVGMIPRFCIVLPVFLCGLFSWGAGFARGAVYGNEN
ncbi:MAG: glycosyltransferase [Candidatus Omnitrophica bacterium]|nr:glycosyltransferase [Candidatus Omnitrophota bacterium]